MTSAKISAILLFSVAIVSFANDLPDACNCVKDGPLLDEALFPTSSIFEGTIKEKVQAENTNDSYYIHFAVSQMLKGTHEASDFFTILSSSNTCDFEFGDIGTKYLVYTSSEQREENFERVSMCSRTHVSTEPQALSKTRSMYGKNMGSHITRTLTRCGKGEKGGKGGKGGKGNNGRRRNTADDKDCDEINHGNIVTLDVPIDDPFVALQVTPASTPMTPYTSISNDVKGTYTDTTKPSSPPTRITHVRHGRRARYEEKRKL
mmetsp:Transcript_27190/g.33331  ORF Transcript_27190/g.33331 Transcript_27190/m.33331 type:complete len:262 (-) Transcript_27190:667-1452(-)